MKIPTYRTFSRAANDINDYFEAAARQKEYRRPSKLLRQMVGNPDYQKFKTLNQSAAQGDVRFHFGFPQSNPDRIILTIGDRKNPTSADVKTYLKNLFRLPYEKEPLPTMNNKEFVNFFKNVVKGAVSPSKTTFYPVKTVEIDPKAPYYENVKNTLREFLNERLFGAAKK